MSVSRQSCTSRQELFTVLAAAEGAAVATLVVGLVFVFFVPRSE